MYAVLRITISYTTPDGERVTETVEGFKAVVIQHEYDHLEGVLFTDKVSTLAKLKLKRKLNDLAAQAVDGKNVREGLPDA
jgi:peptide deformylase